MASNKNNTANIRASICIRGTVIFGTVLTAIVLLAAEARAQDVVKPPESPDAKPQEIIKTPETEVIGHYETAVGTSDAASEGSVTYKRIQTRPLERAGEVIELVPGMVVTQHSGDGKANQPEQSGRVSGRDLRPKRNAVEQLVSLADRIALRLLQLQRGE